MRSWDIGVITGLKGDGGTLAPVKDFGLPVCQVSCWNPSLYSDALADVLREESATSGVAITSLWGGWSGPQKWNFVEGPSTLGIVPPEYRDKRVDELKAAADFSARLEVPAVVTHLGFIPDNPNDPLFGEIVDCVRELAEYMAERNLEFWFETGQETPTTMLRLIEQVGSANLGVNLDPANLILYGSGNPIDSLDVFGHCVKSVHAKDGFYPTDPMKLGREVKVGQGRVRFPEFLARLEEIGYDGSLIIEREISGEQQRKDIAETVGYLKALMD